MLPFNLPRKFSRGTAWLALISMLGLSCQRQGTEKAEDAATAPVANPLFVLLPASQTGVDFANTLTEGLNTNVMMYEYFYNGGGVAVGDVNNDGLEDLYFSGNMVDNRLYLNRGNMAFTDITAAAGVSGRPGPWKTGVSMADVNGDGLTDIYVCYSGKLPEAKRQNQLFINLGAGAKGVPRFEEQAAKYGLASSAFSTQAVFFDYDRDQDLDLFLLNHNPNSVPVLDEVSTAELLKKADPQTGVRLYRNEKNFFTDVTRQARIHSSALSYGLGAGVADINQDGWPDIYISNDYTVPDYLYINNQDGTFTDQAQARLGHVSHFSMGNDIADINNDALPDIYTLDMLPEDNRRQKLLFAPDNYEKFDLTRKSGFHYQYMRNMLQVNNGNGTFSEVGQLAGVSNTDWSWAPLLADFDNDGWKDLFVTNGYLRDYTNLDFIKYMESYTRQKGGRVLREDLLALLHKMPSSSVTNYIYRNNGDMTFANQVRAWGLQQASNSNGAAYADLDNDGDLDLVANNINQPAFIYQNQAGRQLAHHYLQVQLAGQGGNTAGIGARVTLYAGGQQQLQEQMPSRGFQSGVSPVLHFGLGKATQVDSLRIVWASGKQQLLKDIKANQRLRLEEKNATSRYRAARPRKPAFTPGPAPFAFTHQDLPVNDFKRQPLMVNPASFAGPCLVKGDVNGDGLEDVYAGGGAGQAGMLYLQQKGGSFRLAPNPAFAADKDSDDADGLFFDANGDGNTDLYVVSGGYDNFMPEDARLQDRLYLGAGQGRFTKAAGALPAMQVSKSCVRAADLNGDGHPDLFVGGRVIPGRYPEAPRSYVLLNDGQGRFSDATSRLAPELQRIGMVTDAAWQDLNGDGQPELLVVGEWMPLTVFSLAQGRLTERTGEFFAQKYHGWWNKLLVGDFNGDQRPDLVVGNMGRNGQCQASDSQPAELFYKDFDDNGSVDPILCFYIQGKSYPYVTRDELLDQISVMRSRFPDYASYADATLQDIFTAEELQGAQRLLANRLETSYFEGSATGKFVEKALPVAAQVAPVYALAALDYNHDGKQDLLLAGNMNQARLRFGKYDANYGLLLQGDGKGAFRQVPQHQSGFNLKGDVRSILQIQNALVFGINGQGLKAYKGKKP